MIYKLMAHKGFASLDVGGVTRVGKIAKVFQQSRKLGTVGAPHDIHGKAVCAIQSAQLCASDSFNMNPLSLIGENE